MLLGRLGSGGMGRVYLARSPGGRMVAVKVIRANLAEDAGFRARFAREVAAARKVGGLFTAQVVDADLDGPVPWLVTAYVPGTSLSDAVEQQGPLPPRSVLALAAGLAEGVSAIHAAGVIHRDLKPSNVLLAQDGPRIIDFGISSAAEATSLTGTGYMIGSPGFMSPEQAEGLTVGPASDIFSLAGVLIYAARGEGPFGSATPPRCSTASCTAQPNLDHVPDNIRPLISRSLSRDAQTPAHGDGVSRRAVCRVPVGCRPVRLAAAPGSRACPGSEPRRGTPAPTRPGMAGTFGPAFMRRSGRPLRLPVPLGLPVGGGGLPRSMAAATTADPATSGNATIGPPTQTSLAPQTPPPPTQATPPAPGLPGAEGDAGYSGQQGHSGQQGYPGQQGYSGQQGNPGQQGYPGRKARGSSNTPRRRGIRELSNTLSRRGIPAGQGDPVAPGGPGIREAPQARATSGGQLSSRAGRPRACRRSLLPAARPGPGYQERGQWYTPPAGSGQPRKRPRWLLPVGRRRGRPGRGRRTGPRARR